MDKRTLANHRKTEKKARMLTLLDEIDACLFYPDTFEEQDKARKASEALRELLDPEEK